MRSLDYAAKHGVSLLLIKMGELMVIEEWGPEDNKHGVYHDGRWMSPVEYYVLYVPEGVEHPETARYVIKQATKVLAFLFPFGVVAYIGWFLWMAYR